jgi:hypothetical protein
VKIFASRDAEDDDRRSRQRFRHENVWELCSKKISVGGRKWWSVPLYLRGESEPQPRRFRQIEHKA